MTRSNQVRVIRTLAVAGLVLAAACARPVSPSVAAPTVAPTSSASPTTIAGTATPPEGTATTFAIIGDYGRDNADQAAVTNLVSSWGPEYIIGVGDGYYASAGGKGSGRYDESTGAYFCRWLAGITTTGQRCPAGLAPTNAFFPAMGNHDYTDVRPSPDTYLDYFDLPGKGLISSSGNERFYDFVKGPIHFFVLNSNQQEPAGTSSASVQAQWLKAQLAASTSTWNVVYDHHPPYSSDNDHGSTTQLQWPFAEWGADAVVSGHAHTYERIMRDGIVYFVNGLGGSERYGFTTPVAGSASRYNANWGAQKVTVSATSLQFEFYDVAGTLIDSYTIPAG